MFSDKNIKTITWILGIILTAVVLYFSKSHIIIRLFIIALVIILNKFTISKTFKYINIERIKMSLEDFNYEGLNPKFQITVYITNLFLIYSLFIYYMIYGLRERISPISPIGIFLIIWAVVMMIDIFYGPELKRSELKDSTTFMLYGNSKKIGYYKNGIVLGRYIFPRDEILYFKSREKDFTIFLKGNRNIIVYNKSIGQYLERVLATKLERSY